MKKIILLGMLILSISASYAQKQMIKSLEVGDKMPDALITNIENYKAKFAHISDFKGKLLILDFWSYSCSTCIQVMPEMRKLQEEFGDRIQVLLVTKDSNETNKKKFLDKVHPVVLKTYAQLPSVLADTVLSKLLPYQSVPFAVWIDQNGIVCQKTDAGAFADKDVQNFLDGKKIRLTHRDNLLDFDAKQPLWTEGNGRQIPHIKYGSVITENLGDDINAVSRIGTSKDSITKTTRHWMLNQTVVSMYQYVFQESKKNLHGQWESNFTKTTIETNDSARYFPPVDKTKYSEWYKTHTYGYEQQLPTDRYEKQWKGMMKKDLETYFGLFGSVERKPLKCWFLIRTNNSDAAFKADMKGKPILESSANNDSLVFRQQTFESLVGRLRNILNNSNRRASDGVGIVETIDSTAYKGLIDITIPKEMNYMQAKRLLQQYGLDIKEEYKEYDCLILKEKQEVTAAGKTN